MIFRHELKHEINFSDLIAVRQRLCAAAQPDQYAVGGKYRVRSMYFDNLRDKALREKLEGLNYREKFRIRYYNGDTSFLCLEKKTKLNGLGNKQKARLSEEETERLLCGDYRWMKESGRPLVTELYSKMMSQGLWPKAFVDYTREPFTYRPGNVRVTLDYNLRTGIGCREFLNPDCVTIPAGNPVIIMEVKWDEFLPSAIQDAVQLKSRRAAAFSKYAACRIYG